jgi:hypothetical protein
VVYPFWVTLDRLTVRVTLYRNYNRNQRFGMTGPDSAATMYVSNTDTSG